MLWYAQETRSACIPKLARKKNQQIINFHSSRETLETGRKWEWLTDGENCWFTGKYVQLVTKTRGHFFVKYIFRKIMWVNSQKINCIKKWCSREYREKGWHMTNVAVNKFLLGKYLTKTIFFGTCCTCTCPILLHIQLKSPNTWCMLIIRTYFRSLLYIFSSSIAV